jgi:thiol-disulfide isomerase/thioredoxin
VAVALITTSALATPPGRAPVPIHQLDLVRIHTDTQRLGAPEPLLDGQNAVLVATFATWCKPCNKEVPTLNTLSKESKGRGVKIVAISLDEKPAFAVRRWMQERKVTYPVYYGSIEVREGRSILRDLSMMPTIILLSPQGSILRRWLGVVPEKSLRAALEPILRKRR